MTCGFTDALVQQSARGDAKFDEDEPGLFRSFACDVVDALAAEIVINVREEEPIKQGWLKVTDLRGFLKLLRWARLYDDSLHLFTRERDKEPRLLYRFSDVVVRPVLFDRACDLNDALWSPQSVSRREKTRDQFFLHMTHRIKKFGAKDDKDCVQWVALMQRCVKVSCCRSSLGSDSW